MASHQKARRPTPQSPHAAGPSANGDSEGRDPRTGRFLPANKGGPGNPHARQVTRLRAALFSAVTPAEMQKLARAMLKKAKQGDGFCARLLCEYTLGKPEATALLVAPAIYRLVIEDAEAEAPTLQVEDAAHG